MMLELCYSYSYGLRVSEICRLRIRDIDSQRGQLRVAQGKGEKDRRTFARLLAYLPARDMAVSELPVSAPQKAFTQAKRTGGVATTACAMPISRTSWNRDARTSAPTAVVPPQHPVEDTLPELTAEQARVAPGPDRSGGRPRGG